MSYQLPLFEMDDAPSDTHDPISLLREGSALVLSISGGKDSDAMSHYLLDRRAREGWPGDVMMVHADGWARREAAEALGVSVSALDTHLARGLDRLKIELGVSSDV